MLVFSLLYHNHLNLEKAVNKLVKLDVLEADREGGPPGREMRTTNEMHLTLVTIQ